MICVILLPKDTGLTGIRSYSWILTNISNNNSAPIPNIAPTAPPSLASLVQYQQHIQLVRLITSPNYTIQTMQPLTPAISNITTSLKRVFIMW